MVSEYFSKITDVLYPPRGGFCFFTAIGKGISRLPLEGLAFHFTNDFTFLYSNELRILNSQNLT